MTSRFILPSAVLLCFLVTGCSDDDDKPRATSTPTSAPTSLPTATGQPTATQPAPTSTSTSAAAATPTLTPIDTATATPTGTTALTIHDELLVSTEQMVEWVETVFAQGIRRPGYPADVWAEQWIRDQFESFGLENIELDPVEVKRWVPGDCSLTVWLTATPEDVRSIPCFAVPFSKPGPAVEQPLALMAGTTAVAGKIAVVNNDFITLPQSAIRFFSSREYDPDGEFATLLHTLPFSFAFQDVMEPSIEAGAAGFIGIIKAPFDTKDYFVPYDAHERSIPGVWISASEGAALTALLGEGPVSGRMMVDATLDTFTSHNVIATLPGASDEWIIIGSHHDGPWASAVEDGTGISMVLAQARYWSQVPRNERPHNLRFLLNAGHMSGGAGLIAFVERNAAELDEVVLELHLEHASRASRTENGQLIPTDDPEIRWWFTSRIDVLEDAVEAALHAEDLRRSFIMQPDNFPPGSPAPPTDGAFFHTAGVPIMHFLTAPMYLFDAQDTLDKVHEPSLVPITRAAIRIINAMQGRSAAELRAAVRPSPTPAAAQAGLAELGVPAVGPPPSR